MIGGGAGTGDVESAELLQGFGFDRLYGVTRERQSRPAWAAEDSLFVDVTNELAVELRRDRLVAVRMVGIDGSEDSSAALRWALRYAGEHDAVARVVHVWTPLPRYDTLPAGQRERLSADQARTAQQAAERAERMLLDVRPLPAGVEAVTVVGAPGAALVELSQEALILFVGAPAGGSVARDRAERIGRHGALRHTPRVLSGDRDRQASSPRHRHRCTAGTDGPCPDAATDSLKLDATLDVISPASRQDWHVYFDALALAQQPR